MADEQKNALDYYRLKHDQYIVLETASVRQSEDSRFDGLAFEDLVESADLRSRLKPPLGQIKGITYGSIFFFIFFGMNLFN